jgi:DNA-binding transcriptional ArsR family regulator
LGKIHYHLVVDHLSVTFAALSDPTRRAIIDKLSRGPKPVHALNERIKLSQQAVSKHLAYLVRARIIKKRKVGRESVCELLPDAIKRISDWVQHYRSFWEESLDKLESVLEEMKEEGQT